jgi:tetratricopeptide (TPR) repeat protein
MRLTLPFLRSPGSPPPLRAQETRGTTAEARLGALIRRMELPTGLDAAAHEAIRRQLRRAETRREARGREHRRAFVRSMLARPALVMAIAVAMLCLGLVAQAGISWVRRVGLPWSPEAPAAAPLPDARAPTRHARSRRAMAPAITVDEAGGAPDGMPAETQTPSAPASASPPPPPPPLPQKPRLRVGASIAKTTWPPRVAEAPSSLAQESGLLGAALAAVRTDRNYTAALATLDAYDAEFPNGALRGEAALARLDALLALGQSGAALRLLDGHGRGQVPGHEMDGPRAAEMLVVRGELRAGVGRYEEAIDDFDRALALPAGRSLEERALYGRLSCRARVGDAAGASQDLQDYLVKFPDGPRAAELRRRKPGP